MQFYESNNFVFPSCHLLPTFLGRLSPATLTHIQNISISVYLIHSRNSVSILPIGLKERLIESFWSMFGCMGQCSNLQLLNISLDANNCDIQSYVLEQFECQEREATGLHPKVNVAFITCEICKDSKRSHITNTDTPQSMLTILVIWPFP